MVVGIALLIKDVFIALVRFVRSCWAPKASADHPQTQTGSGGSSRSAVGRATLTNPVAGEGFLTSPSRALFSTSAASHAPFSASDGSPAPDYHFAEEMNAYYSETDGLFWDEAINMYYDERCELWYDPADANWKWYNDDAGEWQIVPPTELGSDPFVTE